MKISKLEAGGELSTWFLAERRVEPTSHPENASDHLEYVLRKYFFETNHGNLKNKKYQNFPGPALFTFIEKMNSRFAPSSYFSELHQKNQDGLHNNERIRTKSHMKLWRGWFFTPPTSCQLQPYYFFELQEYALRVNYEICRNLLGPGHFTFNKQMNSWIAPKSPREERHPKL